MKSGVPAVFATGFVLFVLGAANLWGGAGFTMSLGLVLILLAHAVITIRGSPWQLEQFKQTMTEVSKRNQQLTQAVKVGDRIELHSFTPPPT